MKHLLVPTRQKANALILSVLCALFVSPASLAEYTQAQSVALNNNSDEVDYRLVSTKKAMSTSMYQRLLALGVNFPDNNANNTPCRVRSPKVWSDHFT
jgi:hypothetical protein